MAGSVPTARRFVRRRLAGVVDAHLVETAELCVSELATNCVLHAGSEFAVHVEALGDAVRVLVSDASSVLPRVVPYGVQAATGRGLDLVASLSAAWGVDRSPGSGVPAGAAGPGRGKTVWCEIRADAQPEPDLGALLDAWADDLDDLDHAGPARAEGPVDTPAAAAPTPAGGRPGLVRLLGYPVRRGVRAREHSDALLRECALLRSSEVGGSSGAPGRLVDLAAALQERYAAELDGPTRVLLAAHARGEESVDLEYPALPEAAALVQQWRAAVVEMDEFCRQERLLTLETPSDVLALNDWVLGEFDRQLGGAEPRRWPGPPD